MGLLLSTKLRQLRPGILVHWCPGCEELHPVHVRDENAPAGPKWSWNGDVYAPTFSPSLKQMGDKLCHYFVHDGWISFCTDSWHRLAGMRVPLPDLPNDN